MTPPPPPPSAARPGGRRARLAARAALVVLATVGLLPAASATASGPSTVVPGDGSPADQAPPPDGDQPLPTNPPSPRLAEVRAHSAELTARVDDRLDAEDALADAERHLQGRRDHLVALAADRVVAVDLLARRRSEEARRIDERVAAEAVHRDRLADEDAAEDEVADAEDALRQSVIAAYMNAGSETTRDLGPLVTGVDATGAVLRDSATVGTTAGREAELEARGADLRRATERRERAERALEAAVVAEVRAVDDREATEAEIVSIDEETTRTRRDEVAAVDGVTRRGGELLVAVAAEVPARLRADVVGVDFPVVALDAWVKASETAPCRTPWWALAGISRIESRHGTYRGGRLDARGRPTVPIIGPRLDGSGGFAAIRDTDGGRLDGDAAFDRAVGPMQFIPSTWARWGRDGDGDGERDPHSIYDAAAAAAAYLCFGRSDLADESQLRAAYFSYNHSQVYVSAVLAEAHRYRAALTLPT